MHLQDYYKSLSHPPRTFVDTLFSIYHNAFTIMILWNGIMTLYELLRHSYVKNKPSIALKLDFEKAYSKVNWDFLLDCHAMGGFNKNGLIGLGNCWGNCLC